MRSEFERWLGDVWLSDAKWDESKNTYSDSRIHCMWSAWQHQQTKVDELEQSYMLLESDYLKECKEKDELQKRMNEIIQQSKDFIRSCKNDAEIFEDTNAAGKAYGAEAVVELLEQAFKGGEA